MTIITDSVFLTVNRQPHPDLEIATLEDAAFHAFPADHARFGGNASHARTTATTAADRAKLNLEVTSSNDTKSQQTSSSSHRQIIMLFVNVNKRR
jgi:hypothetical protein